MKKTIILIGLILITLFLLGCTESVEPQPVCGDDEYYDSGFCASFLNMNVEESKNKLSLSKPFGIIDWKFNEEWGMEITIKNNSNESLKIKSIQVDLKKYNSNAFYNLDNKLILYPEKIYEDVAGINVLKVLKPKETTIIIVDKIFLYNSDQNIIVEHAPKGSCSAVPRLDFIPLIFYETTNGTTQTQKEKTPLIISCK